MTAEEKAQQDDPVEVRPPAAPSARAAHKVQSKHDTCLQDVPEDDDDDDEDDSDDEEGDDGAEGGASPSTTLPLRMRAHTRADAHVCSAWYGAGV